ncbi:metallophosphoesterase [uncultured Sphingomonas sp.]|uniref:metallophosphoesterase n=1 Tax=uncultured Sphingomonas sp. TaxID=158754 RepID=UPI0026361133|nr:metallophosphoesterase [uncultured Sphingomonas sp.]
MRRWIVLVVALAGLAALAGLGLRNARADPVVRTAAIALPDWPDGAAPVRVALLSDLHFGNLATDEARLARVVALTNAQRPDIVFIAGDILAGYRDADARARAAPVAHILHGLRAPLGVFVVFGNHDDAGGGAVPRALAGAGLGATQNVAVRAGPLALGLSGDTSAGTARLGPVYVGLDKLRRRVALATVFVTHSPDLMQFLPTDHALLLAGHTHCGQIVLPLIGPLINVSRVSGNLYRCGLIRAGGRILVVSAGIGTSNVPLRFGAPPDLWLLTLGPEVRSNR